MHRSLRGICSIFVAAILTSSASCETSQSKGAMGAEMGMATRSVSAFLTKERSLEGAIAQGDKKTASGLLAETFEFRTGRNDVAVGREEWLMRKRNEGGEAGLIRGLSVREFQSVAVVSFVLDYRGRSGSRRAAYLTVDVWDSATGQLQSRYVDEMKRPPQRWNGPTGYE